MEENKNKMNELNDEDLEKVTGGANLKLHFFDTKDEVKYILTPKQTIKVKENFLTKTVRCEVVSREPFYDPQYHCYVDSYVVRGLDGSDLFTRILRDDIVNEAH